MGRSWKMAASCGVMLAAGIASAGTAMFEVERTTNAATLSLRRGQPILTYLLAGTPKGEQAPSVESACYTHPLYAPSGAVLTDVGPKDHPHHRGIFCAWVKVEGEKPGDWWGWGALAPKDDRRIVHREARAGAHSGGLTLHVENEWLAEGTPVLRERLDVTASRSADVNVADYRYEFAAPTDRPVVIAQSPFGGFCYRAKPRGRLTVTGPGGAVDLPNSVHTKAETNWPAADWYDLSYETPEGKVDGVAVMSHPSNPPTTWHVVRNIHMLNPAVTGAGPVEIRPGAPLVLRYRVVAHDGPPAAEVLAKLRREFAAQ